MGGGDKSSRQEMTRSGGSVEIKRCDELDARQDDSCLLMARCVWAKSLILKSSCPLGGNERPSDLHGSNIE